MTLQQSVSLVPPSTSVFNIGKHTNRVILRGHVLEQLRRIPDRRINCVITSPPYYDQREYHVDGQWGKEENYRLYLNHLYELQCEIRRILTNDGVFVINIGDKYAQNDELDVRAGSLYGVPEEFIVDCRRSGWIRRNTIIYEKLNPIPSSVKTRIGNRWEYCFILVKQKNHYFDLDSVKVPAKTQKPAKFNLRVRESKNHRLDKKYGNAWKASKKEHSEYNKRGVKKDVIVLRKQDNTKGADGKPLSHYKGFNDRWNEKMKSITGLILKNPGDVLHLAVNNTEKIDHYSMFPIGLPEFFIKCCCRPQGIVLDPFLGAGTTAVAAENLRRRWIGIELSKHSVIVARNRINGAIVHSGGNLA